MRLSQVFAIKWEGREAQTPPLNAPFRLIVGDACCCVFCQFRAEAFIKSVSGDKRTADALKPAVTTTSVTRQRTSSISSPVPVPASSSSPAYRRRSSVSVVVVGPAESRHRTAVTRSVSSSLPLPVRSTSPVRRGSPVRSGSPIRRGSPVPYSRRHLPAAESVVVTDIKSHVSPSDVPSPAAVQAIFDVRRPTSIGV